MWRELFRKWRPARSGRRGARPSPVPRERAELRQPLLLALRRDADDVPGEAEALHRADDRPGRVELAPAEAVDRRPGEGVVVVVPGLAEGREREPPDVGRPIVGREPAGSVEVADRVDRPGHVV